MNDFDTGREDSFSKANLPGQETPWVSILVLTRNESLHIRRCIESARKLTPYIFVVDSNSSDETAAYAIASGANVTSGEFSRFADKLNWSLEHIDFPTPWVFRLDADEILSESLVSYIKSFVNAAPVDVTGVHVRRQLWFMGTWVKHGGMYPIFSLRLWKKGSTRCESRDLDEYMIMQYGRSIYVNLDIIDNPLSDLTTWIDKHNRYATLEAQTALFAGNTDSLIKPSLLGDLASRRRWIKLHLFYRLPLFVRPLIYFMYRYFLRLGFLDGRTGFIFHFLHSLWYRTLVDSKILEMTKNLKPSNLSTIK